MFDVGFWEFALIGVITLIIVGPERMPALARKAGQYVGKVKRFIAKVQDDIGHELDADTLKKQLSLEDEKGGVVEILQQTKDTLSDIKKDTNNKE